jgi:hypothetical protein
MVPVFSSMRVFSRWLRDQLQGIINLVRMPRIDEIEDDILRQKLKIQKVAMELDDTFDDMMTKY